MINLSDKIKKNFYYDILRIRRVEEAISEKYNKFQMRCPVHLSIGQEAIAVGVSKNLDRNDQMVSNHRSHAHYLSKGGSLNKMIAEIYGKKTGCNSGRGGSMNLSDLNKGFVLSLPIVGGTIPIGVGLALEKKLCNKKGIVVIYLGDAATEQGVFYESLNFANLQNLRCLFVIENNFYSVYTNITERRKNKNLIEIKELLKTKTFNAKGNEIIDVYKKSSKAISYIKKYNQPSMIVLETYRHLEHCGPNNDDYLGYRDFNEIKNWQAKCPLKLFEKKLINQKILSNKDISLFEKKIKNEIENSFKFADKSPYPELSTSKNYIYD